jgi:S-adenosylmethionine:tRNA ribosyltransferase-isomerase
VLVADFNYHLPPELIAQEPLRDRASSRQLHLTRATGRIEDCTFRNFPDLLRPDDLLVLNNTRVFPARLFGHRTGIKSQPVSPRNPSAKEFLRGKVEVLLTRQLSKNPNVWECLVHPGRKIGVGEQLFLGNNSELQAEVLSRTGFGERQIRFAPVPDFFSTIERIGHVPLPPYIARVDTPADQQRYQTIYARARGSVAAPTAGLHFTTEILDRIKQRGIEMTEITLHVGLGTFQPVRVERVEDHKLHSEWFSITPPAAERINAALQTGRRVVAVGTTTVRTLEFAALQSRDGKLSPTSGEASLFIYPGFEFKVVGAMLTNFHLPQSTLLMLVSAFSGRNLILQAYRHAVEQKYRFYSYGDCMFID